MNCTQPPQKSLTFEELWTNLKDGFSQVYSGKFMDVSQYMKLYGQVYSYCTGVFYAEDEGRRSTRRDRNRRNDGFEMYNQLEKFFKDLVESICENNAGKSDEDVLKLYIKEWETFRTGSKTVSLVFSYFNRHWTRREIDEGNEKVYETYTLALVSWKNLFFEQISRIVTDGVLKLIELERNGEEIDTALISCVIQSYIELGIKEPSSKRDLSVYVEYFEKRFLEETEAYFALKADEFITANRGADLTKTMQSVLEEEKARCARYLHESTGDRLEKAMERVLVSKRPERSVTEQQ